MPLPFEYIQPRFEFDDVLLYLMDAGLLEIPGPFTEDRTLENLIEAIECPIKMLVRNFTHLFWSSVISGNRHGSLGGLIGLLLPVINTP